MTPSVLYTEMDVVFFLDNLAAISVFFTFFLIKPIDRKFAFFENDEKDNNENLVYIGKLSKYNS